MCDVMQRKLIELVDVEKADATLATDKAMILRRIRKTATLEDTNTFIRNAIRGSEFCVHFPSVLAAMCGLQQDWSRRLQDVNEQRGDRRLSVVMAAAGAGYMPVLRELLTLPGADVRVTGKNKKTALM